MTKSEERTVRVQLRLTPSEAAQLAKLSTGLGVTKTQAVRQAVAALLGEPMAGAPAKTGPGGPGERAIFFQLDRIRSNLKQLEPVGLPTMKFGEDRVEVVEAYEWRVPQMVLKSCLTDVEREKAAADLRDHVGRPLAELVLRHNRGETVTTQQVHEVAVLGPYPLMKAWKAANAA